MSLAHEAYPLLERLAFQISTTNLELVRRIKSSLLGLTRRVQKVRDEIEQLMDDDGDMAEMYLTQKRLLAEERSESERLGGHRDDGSDHSHSHTPRESLGGFGSSISAPVSPAGSPTKHGSHYLDGRPSGLGPAPSISFWSGAHSASDSTATSVENVEELEMLLEAYFVVIDGTLNKLTQLSQYIDDTEDFINIQLDNVRNQLIQFELIMTTAGEQVEVKQSPLASPHTASLYTLSCLPQLSGRVCGGAGGGDCASGTGEEGGWAVQEGHVDSSTVPGLCKHSPLPPSLPTPVSCCPLQSHLSISYHPLAGFVVALWGEIAGTFGMNVPLGLEEDPSALKWILIDSGVGGVGQLELITLFCLSEHECEEASSHSDHPPHLAFPTPFLLLPWPLSLYFQYRALTPSGFVVALWGVIAGTQAQSLVPVLTLKLPAPHISFLLLPRPLSYFYYRGQNAMAGFVVALWGVIAGTFGMNVPLGLEEDQSALKWILIDSGVGGVLIFLAFLAYFRYKNWTITRLKKFLFTVLSFPTFPTFLSFPTFPTFPTFLSFPTFLAFPTFPTFPTFLSFPTFLAFPTFLTFLAFSRHKSWTIMWCEHWAITRMS
ncbi:unnamed protein product [Closterium sp. NIES-54]